MVAAKGFDLAVIGSSKDVLETHVYPFIEPEQLEEFQARAKQLIKDGQNSAR